MSNLGVRIGEFRGACLDLGRGFDPLRRVLNQKPLANCPVEDSIQAGDFRTVHRAWLLARFEESVLPSQNVS